MSSDWRDEVKRFFIKVKNEGIQTVFLQYNGTSEMKIPPGEQIDLLLVGVGDIFVCMQEKEIHFPGQPFRHRINNKTPYILSCRSRGNSGIWTTWILNHGETKYLPLETEEIVISTGGYQ
jgi:hypothetical protein